MRLIVTLCLVVSLAWCVRAEEPKPAAPRKEEKKLNWKPLFDGPAAPFSWTPETVVVLDSGTLAHSSGPVKDREGKVTGNFNSVWRRDKDGQWRVVFDKGCP